MYKEKSRSEGWGAGVGAVVLLLGTFADGSAEAIVCTEAPSNCH